MSNELTELKCPDCGTVDNINIKYYFSVEKNPEIKEQLLAGLLGCHKCEGCGFVGFVSMPMIYDDRAVNLLVYVCDEDRESLVQEFHALLEYCRNDLTEEMYEEALSRPFQIVLGPNTLARIVYALENGIYCYRMTDGLDERAPFDKGDFLVIAKHYRLAGENEEAFQILQVAAKFRTGDPYFYRELGAYAFTAGHLEKAEEFLLLAEQLQKKRSHILQKIVPAEGPITKIPEGVALPKLSEKMKTIYESLRPELFLSDEQLAVLAGTLLGEFDRAVEKLEYTEELKFYREHAEYEFQRLLDKKANETKNKMQDTCLEARANSRRSK